jgi:hypothetical protein
MDKLADITARSIGDPGGAGRVLRRQRAYHAAQQGGHIGRAATYCRLSDASAKGAPLFRRLLGKSATQHIYRIRVLC